MEKKYKRPMDLGILLAVHVMPLSAPICLLVWVLVPLLIWLEDRGPIFYKQKRLGKGGKEFYVIKFRTMSVDAEKDTGPVWAADRDPRTTRVGKLMRSIHLDEYPQIINVLKGDMSLVGPRPERPELHDLICESVPDFDQRLQVKPGIAGSAQVSGPYDMGPSEKLTYDLDYINRMSPFLDLLLIILSVQVSLTRVLKRPSSEATGTTAQIP